MRRALPCDPTPHPHPRFPPVHSTHSPGGSGSAKLGAGESLYVVGDCAALGDNDASKALPMTLDEATETWSLVVPSISMGVRYVSREGAWVQSRDCGRALGVHGDRKAEY